MKKISEDPVLSKIYPDAAKFEPPENYSDFENDESLSEGKMIENAVDIDEFNEYIED
jgi:hypothetical protein